MARASFLLVSAGVVVAAWVSPLRPQRVDEVLDPFALGFVLLVSVSFTVAAHGLGALSRALRAALMTEPRSAEEAQGAAVTLQTLRSSLSIGGAIGLMIGFVHLLADMSDPSSLRPAVAAACLPLLYGVVLGEALVAPMVRSMVGLEPSAVTLEGSPHAPHASVIERALGTALGLTVLVAAMTSRNNFLAFIDLTALGLVSLGASLITCAVHGGGRVTAALKAALSGSSLSAEEAGEHAAVVQNLRSSVLTYTLVGTTLGYAQMLFALDDPAAVGPAMALALLASLYGLIVGELLVAPSLRGLRAQANVSASEPAHSVLIAATCAGANLGGMVLIAVLFSGS